MTGSKFWSLAFSSLLGVSGSLWADHIAMDWTEGMKYRSEKNIPAMVYIGKEESEFFKRGVSEKAKKFVNDEQIALIQLDLNETGLKYPLTGELSSAINIGVLMSGAINDMAGRVIMLNRDGVIMPTLRYSRYVHNCDPVIIEDLMRYVIEDRDIIEFPITTEYAKLRRHQLQWKGFRDRLRDVNMTQLFRPIKKHDMVYRYKDIKGIIRTIDKFNKLLLLVSQEYGDIERAMISDFKSAYAGKGMMVVILPENDLPQVFEDHQDFKNMELYAFVGPNMSEYPLMFYRFDEDVLRAKGYMPALFYRGLFEADEDYFKDLESFDVNMPIGEYRVSDG
jgi:hypothetical protein